MKLSYNWLKWYVPEVPKAEKLSDIFTFHICEVEEIIKKGDDFIFDIKVLPDRAHDLLSVHGVARELASLLNINFVDPTPKYKLPSISPSLLGRAGEGLKIDVESLKCRRYMGRIVRNVQVAPSPEWVTKHLESIGQRSINNMVDAANLTMFDCGQPTHIFDLDKIKGKIIVRFAKEGEEMVTLDNKNCKLKNSDLVIADEENILAIAGVKGGKIAEVDADTKNIILECANFDPVSVRKTAQSLNILTDAKKRFENDLSPELCSFAMLELSALILEIYPDASFEEIVDVYPEPQKEKKLSFTIEKISKILGIDVSVDEVKDILKRYNFLSKEENGVFEIIVPKMRLDLNIPEDMTEEIVRVLGYDRIKIEIPKINFTPSINETFSKMMLARNKLLNDGYSEVMTYTFRDKGELEVLASASDKKFLRTNLSDGLKESFELNKKNIPLLGLKEIKIFEIGNVFKKSGEEMHVAFADKKGIKEMKLDEYVKAIPVDAFVNGRRCVAGDPEQKHATGIASALKFKMWSIFPFIVRDIALWVPENVTSDDVSKIIKENMGEMVVRGPELFDEFKKGEKISYAFKLVFQSYERTLTDLEVNDFMSKITFKIKQQNNWEVR